MVTFILFLAAMSERAPAQLKADWAFRMFGELLHNLACIYDVHKITSLSLKSLFMIVYGSMLKFGMLDVHQVPFPSPCPWMSNVQTQP